MRVVEEYDCTVLCGERLKEAQERAFDMGKSKVSWPNSYHNTRPDRPVTTAEWGLPLLSHAVDVAPWPIDWEDLDRFHRFSHYVLGVSDAMNINLRWGGDWDRDWNLTNNGFDDLPHYELVLD